MILYKLNVLLDRRECSYWATDLADLQASYDVAYHAGGWCEVLQVDLDDLAVAAAFNGQEPPEDTVRETPLGGLLALVHEPSAAR